MIEVHITTEISDKLEEYMVRNGIEDISEALEKLFLEIGFH